MRHSGLQLLPIYIFLLLLAKYYLVLETHVEVQNIRVDNHIEKVERSSIVLLPPSLLMSIFETVYGRVLELIE